ncbi:hypothetical protein SLEP1_g18895 [Rubroshorea leprosula]|uniref:Uncharacterized protein n=1 Tax=Rubroshorea leprosula TaxID=152421 RepID=A0AAV5J4X1_9ROSI|nr:hypothetical protein SLEP1_g18895 [Rubroshorea leprosula]
MPLCFIRLPFAFINNSKKPQSFSLISSSFSFYSSIFFSSKSFLIFFFKLFYFSLQVSSDRMERKSKMAHDNLKWKNGFAFETWRPN